jgi:hypothetical protein
VYNFNLKSIICTYFNLSFVVCICCLVTGYFIHWMQQKTDSLIDERCPHILYEWNGFKRQRHFMLLRYYAGHMHNCFMTIGQSGSCCSNNVNYMSSSNQLQVECWRAFPGNFFLLIFDHFIANILFGSRYWPTKRCSS